MDKPVLETESVPIWCDAMFVVFLLMLFVA